MANFKRKRLTTRRKRLLKKEIGQGRADDLNRILGASEAVFVI